MDHCWNKGRLGLLQQDELGIVGHVVGASGFVASALEGRDSVHHFFGLWTYWSAWTVILGLIYWAVILGLFGVLVGSYF